jgi:D-alanyl-D-alanine endopeptidase (penicillin-binding protein 7)
MVTGSFGAIARCTRALLVALVGVVLPLSVHAKPAERTPAKADASKAQKVKTGAPDRAARAPAARAPKKPVSARTVAGRPTPGKAPRARISVSRERATLVKASYAPRAVQPARLSLGQAIGLHLTDDPLDLRSSVALAIDMQTGESLYEKNAEAVLPIASITKVMTAMVVLDAGLPMDEVLLITEADRDTERHSGSRLPIGSRLTRAEMIHLALMSSENRAAHALGRQFPGGMPAFVAAMNAKAQAIGMANSRFADPTGLSSDNVSNARDLARLVRAAHRYPAVREYSTATETTVDTGYRRVAFRTTNRLVDKPGWHVGMQKTGYISEAGKCLVMLAEIEGRRVIVVLLDASESNARYSDAQRLRNWVAEQPRAVQSARADASS